MSRPRLSVVSRLCLVLCTLTGALGAAEALAPKAAHARASLEDRARIARPIAWRIDGGKAPSFLLGTMHAGVSASELPARVHDALASSRLFVMEALPARSRAELMAIARSGEALPMDLDLAVRAVSQHVPLVTLETLRFQTELLRTLEVSNDELAALRRGDEELGPMVDAYRRGDLAALVRASGELDAETQRLLLDDRNHAWMGRLCPALREGGLFIAVGAGHMPGEDGLLHLLQRVGFELQAF